MGRAWPAGCAPAGVEPDASRRRRPPRRNGLEVTAGDHRFRQKQPHEGAEPTERTEIRLAYDDAALYVGARMYAKDPSRVQAPVGRRDNIAQREHVVISLDTYHDRRTASGFAITASGVRGDFYVATDDENDTNASYDPVWDGRAHRDALGWTAEMRIPFNQLRFNAADQQTWGVNFERWIPSTKEDIFWSPIPSNVTARASRMGMLHGIAGIQPSRRVELLPYVAGAGQRNSDRDPLDPFDDGRNLDARVGADVKMGLGPSLTLHGSGVREASSTPSGSATAAARWTVSARWTPPTPSAPSADATPTSSP